MSKLTDVSSYCELLSSSKITDQTKGLNGLKILLDDEKLRRSLNKSHELKKLPNWNSIFLSISENLKKDCDAFSRSHTSWTETNRKNKIKRLEDLFHFAKRTIRIANTGYTRLKLTAFLNFLMGLWSEAVFVADFGATILKIIDDSVLHNRKSCTELSDDAVNFLFTMCEQELIKNDENRKFVASAVFRSLTNILVKKFDFPDNPHLHEVFLECMKSLMHAKSSGIVKNIVAAVNMFIKWCSMTHRALCCEFGEDCLDIILKIWRESNLQDNNVILGQLIEFCSMQISLHHPKMATTVSLGFYTKNCEIWSTQLYSILVAADLQLSKQQSGVQYRVKDESAHKLDSRCVKLAGDAFCVILGMKKAGSFAMRKAIGASNSFIKNIDFGDMKSVMSSFTVDRNRKIADSAKPWFAIMNYLLQSHKRIFDPIMLKSMIIKLHSLIMNANFDSFGPTGLELMQNTIELFSNHYQADNPDVFPELCSIWKDCWNVAISCLSASTNESMVSSSLDFLNELIEMDYSIGKSFFYTTGVSKTVHNFWTALYLHVPPSRTSICLVITFARNYGLKFGKNENDVFSTILQTTATNVEFANSSGYKDLIEKEPLKIMLLHWLLGFKEDILMDKNMPQSPRVMQPSQAFPRDASVPVSIISPNLPFKDEELSKLCEMCADLLSNISYKDCIGSTTYFSPHTNGDGIDDVISMFLQPDYVASFKHFNFESLPWLFSNKPARGVKDKNLPQSATITETILSILLNVLGLVQDKFIDVVKENVPLYFGKTCQSFFLFANTTGNFFYISYQNSKLSTKFFENWVQKFTQFMTQMLLHLKRNEAMINDSFFVELSENFENLLKIFFKLESLINEKSFSKAKDHLKSPTLSLCQIILAKFRNAVQQNDSVQEESSPNSIDDTLGLTQQSSSSVGHGYKRRKYSEESGPPSKQRRYSTPPNLSSNMPSKNGCSEFDTFSQDHHVTKSLKLLFTTCFHFHEHDVTKEILSIAVDLDPSKMEELRQIYSVLAQISSICTVLTSEDVDDVLDIFKAVFGVWYKDQDVSMAFMALLAKIIESISYREDSFPFEDMMKRIDEMVGIFWKFALSGKCSNLSRIGISACLFAIIQYDCLNNGAQELEKILQLLADNNDNVRLITIFFIGRMITAKCGSSSLEKLRREVFLFAEKASQELYEVSESEFSKVFLSLSTCLHCLCAAVSNNSHVFEEKAHYLLCCIESLFHKYKGEFANHGDNIGVVSRCMSFMSKTALSSVCHYYSNDETFYTDYKDRHLKRILYAWLENKNASLEVRMESLPVGLFGFDNLKAFCSNYVNQTFSAIFCRARNSKELKDMFNKYYRSVICSEQEVATLKSLLTMCMPDAFGLVLPVEAFPRDKSCILDEVFLTQKSYVELLYRYLGQVIVDFFMKIETEHCESSSHSEEYFKSSLLKLVSFTTAGSRKSKVTTKEDLNKLLATLIFDKTHAHHVIVNALVRTRYHFERAWYPHEYKNCAKAYYRFITMLFKSGQIPKELTVYFVSDVISMVLLHSVDFKMKLAKADLQYDKSTIIQSVTTFSALLLELCSFLKQSGAAAKKKTLETWRISIPIVSLVVMLKFFCHSLEGHDFKDLKHELSQILQVLTQIIHDFSNITVFQKILPFMDTSGDASVEECLEVFENSYIVLNDLGLINSSNPIIENACEALAVKLRSSSEPMESAVKKKLMDCVLMMMEMAKSSCSSSPSVVNAIIEVYSTTSKLEHLSEFNSDDNRLIKSEKNMINKVLLILTQAVFCISSKISHSASVSLQNLLQLPNVKLQLSSSDPIDDYLESILVAFTKSPDVYAGSVSQGIDQLKVVLSELKGIDEGSSNSWICSLTSSLIDFCHNQLFHSLRSVCSKLTKLSSWILCYVVHDILVNDPTQRARSALSQYFQACFKAFLESTYQQKDAMRALLDAIQFLRSQNISEIAANFRRQKSSTSETLTAWNNNFWLDFDYLNASKVAVLCSRPCMAIIFAEIWKESVDKNFSPLAPSSCRSLSKALFEMEADGDSAENNHNKEVRDENLGAQEMRESILINAYCRLEDVDSLYGLRKGSTDGTALMMHIHDKESNWLEALEGYNSLMGKVPSTQIAHKLISSLHCCGLDHISQIYNKNLQLEGDSFCDGDHLDRKSYKAALEAGKWGDEFGNSSEGIAQSGFDQCFSYLMDQHPAFIPLTEKLTKEAFISMPQEISKLAIFDTEVLESVTKLLVIRDLVDANTLISQNQTSKGAHHFERWSVNPLASSQSSLFTSYPCAELIISSRKMVVEIITKLDNHPGKYESAPSRIIRHNMLKQVDLAALHRRERSSLRMISFMEENLLCQMGKTALCPTAEYYELVLKEVQLLWDVGKKTEALFSLVKLQDSIQDGFGKIEDEVQLHYFLATVLQLRGKWLNDMKMDGPSSIMENYLKKSVTIASSLHKSETEEGTAVSNYQVEQLCVSGYKTLGEFADAQYREVIEYMTSKEFEHKRSLVREAQQEMAKAKPQQGQNQKYFVLLQKNYKMDHKEFTNILETKEKFLLSAVENYVKCLTMTDDNDILMYRICSLWFDNTQSSSLPGLIRCACSELQTHKFVDICYQLAARLNVKSADKNFQGTLEKLLKSMALKHPYHVLPVLFALASAHRDNDLLKVGGKKGSTTTHDATSKAAQKIINEVKKVRGPLVTMMEDLSDAYIEFANWDVSRYAKTTGTPISFDKGLLINKYCNSQLRDKFSLVAVPTVDIPINKKGDYQTMLYSVALSNFKGYFQLCGGINLPKIVVALSSDGSERKHLVKGRDDLRQDAVMQHVFKVANTLLKSHEGQQNLKLRTYKVVPLSQRSGLVEWCEGTIPIGNYLIGVPVQKNFGAHHRYRPNDLLSYECRKKLHLAGGKSLKIKFDTYKGICSKFKPVFRHFFYENFVEPAHWFQRRTAYCKSVAVSSIVGYVLGLGDRHVQNILIDRTTGEVIHIDLGVAFEQGKCLPTPEMVPFRLTRDIVDGFGSSGVEGVFRRNCERCVTVMRTSIDTISTIVEVLLHDPLHDWMMTSSKAMQVQRQDASNVESEMTASVLNASTVAQLLQNESANIASSANPSSLAGRALLRVKEKLRGLESGSIMSVEGQVNLLIQQATDEERLCAMFAGWQPYI